ncbi:MAG TPA: lipopolysaccharide heptosyltransferase II [Candidatus Acidoferrales bacterium]|nr:lipopolysaccharide heptosyltransferase II [Candidatus Acidoferrales bacterium]
MKLLIRATNWVGDAVMCIPALEAIRAHWPEADISILARPWVADLYRGQPFANQIIPLDASARSPFAMENIARELRREHFDSALLLQNAFSAAWLARRARIPERIGYARDARRFLLTRAVRVPRAGEIPTHESYYYLELLRRIGWLDKLPAVSEIRLQLAPDASEAAESRLQKAGVHSASLRIALAPGAAYGAAKCWLPERFAAVADSLVDEFKADVILFGTSSEVEVSRQIAARMRHQPMSLVGRTPIEELPALFSRCHLFIGNDSGAMHVAAAVGVPVVGVFGSTDPHGTAPVTPRRTLVQRKVACSPCFLRECPIDHRCMTRVTVADVHAAALKWLEQPPRA